MKNTQHALIDSLGWFIGSGMDDETIKALDEDDGIQKAIARKEMNKKPLSSKNDL